MIKNYEVVNNYLSPGLFKSIKNRLVDPSVPFYKSKINNNAGSTSSLK